MARRERLPLDRQHPVPLQIPERPVVRQHVEPVVDPLQPPAGPVPTVRPLPRVGPDHVELLVHRETPHPGQQLVLGQVGERVEHGRDELVLGVGVEVDQRDGGPRLGLDVGEQRAGHVVHARPVLLQVVGPHPAPVGQVDPLEE